MRINNTFYKKVMISAWAGILVLLAVSCSKSNTVQSGQGKNHSYSDSDMNESKEPPAIPDAIQQTIFEKDRLYLSEKGIILSDMSSDQTISTEIFLELLVETYEAIGGEIDLSNVNPRNHISDAEKKMTLIGVYENYFMEGNSLDTKLDYAAAAYWFMKLHDAVQERFYWNSDKTATTGDLLRRIDVSNALYTWTEDREEMKGYRLSDLLDDKSVTLDYPLTRLLAAEMLVSSYEDIQGEIKMAENPKFSDTDNIYALKSNQLFFWPETDQFEPEKLGRWDEWAFTSAIVYDSQVRLSLGLEETNVPYGAVTAAMASFIRAYEAMEQSKMEEVIVLNERSYDWQVYQYDTGEYGYNNCMPSSVEMAMRYQGLANTPSAEQMRTDNLMDGMGWYDGIAENVMKQYGLQFTDSWEINQEIMLKYLDEGNVLFVMYWEPSIENGHASIIKGYWKQGDSVKFIVADPANNLYGPFGYIETIRDAETMILNMESHVPRYFVIPSGELN